MWCLVSCRILCIFGVDPAVRDLFKQENALSISGKSLCFIRVAAEAGLADNLDTQVQ
jgi:hypothetical protein